jgi:hypothetical protein
LTNGAITDLFHSNFIVFLQRYKKDLHGFNSMQV